MPTQPRTSDRDVDAARTRRFQLSVLVVLTTLAIGVGAVAALLVGMLRGVGVP